MTNLYGGLSASGCCLCSEPAALPRPLLCVSIPGGKFGCRATISAAVAAAGPGDTIVVTPGTYKEQVTITKPVSLVALGFVQPIIDATGLPNGIFINGMAAAPNAGVANVVVSGFKIRNANFEGILIANASNVTIVNNHVLDNNKALDIATPACPGIPAFETNEGRRLWRGHSSDGGRSLLDSSQ